MTDSATSTAVAASPATSPVASRVSSPPPSPEGCLKAPSPSPAAYRLPTEGAWQPHPVEAAAQAALLGLPPPERIEVLRARHRGAPLPPWGHPGASTGAGVPATSGAAERGAGTAVGGSDSGGVVFVVCPRGGGSVAAQAREREGRLPEWQNA